jgi:hypothetical protein
MTVVCKYVNERVFHHKMMMDPNKQHVMQFLARLQIITYYLDSPVHPLIILKSVQITVTHGRLTNVLSACVHSCKFISRCLSTWYSLL